MSYPECKGCVATPFCKLFSGEVQSRHTDWCRARFKLDKAIELSNIPRRYREAHIYNFKMDEANAADDGVLAQKAMEIVDLVDVGKNFFFYGSRPGTGKTFAAACLLNQFIYKTCMTSRFNFEDPLALFVVFPDLVDSLRYSRDDDEVKETVTEIMTVPLLLLDDIGAGSLTDFVREQTFRIINFRLNTGLSTIVTSNYSSKQLASEDALGVRVVSRLLAGTLSLAFAGQDRRLPQ